MADPALAPPDAAPVRALLHESVGEAGDPGGLWLGALLGAPADGAWNRGTAAAAQALRRYVLGNKTDAADCAALLEAARNPKIRPVRVKGVEQQALQALHRLRSQWMATHTRRINGLRGFCREFGLAVPRGARVGLQSIAALVADGGPDVSQFRDARRLACWFGITPKEYSSGETRRLGRISKAGRRYLRTLLTHGARSVLQAAAPARSKGRDCQGCTDGPCSWTAAPIATRPPARWPTSLPASALRPFGRISRSTPAALSPP